MRVVSSSRTALERQTREAVRIRRRGGVGAILNSKAEYGRSYIPCLQLEDTDTIRELELEEKREEDERDRELAANQLEWEQEKSKERRKELKRVAREQGKPARSISSKQRREEGASTPRSKKRRYDLISTKWGEQKEGLLINSKREQRSGEQFGGGSLVALPFHDKAPSVVIQEGDPPIGKVRGALRGGTGPPPPPGPESRKAKDLGEGATPTRSSYF